MDARQGKIGPPSLAPYRRGGPIAVEGVKQRLYSIQPVEGATKPVRGTDPNAKGTDGYVRGRDPLLGEPKFTTSRHRTRSDAHIVALIAVDFRCKSVNRSEDASHRRDGFLRCTSHCTNRLFWSHVKLPNGQAVLDGVPPTGLQLLK